MLLSMKKKVINKKERKDRETFNIVEIIYEMGFLQNSWAVALWEKINLTVTIKPLIRWSINQICKRQIDAGCNDMLSSQYLCFGNFNLIRFSLKKDDLKMLMLKEKLSLRETKHVVQLFGCNESDPAYNQSLFRTKFSQKMMKFSEFVNSVNILKFLSQNRLRL